MYPLARAYTGDMYLISKFAMADVKLRRVGERKGWPVHRICASSRSLGTRDCHATTTWLHTLGKGGKIRHLIKHCRPTLGPRVQYCTMSCL